MIVNSKRKKRERKETTKKDNFSITLHVIDGLICRRFKKASFKRKNILITKLFLHRHMVL